MITTSNTPKNGISSGRYIPVLRPSFVVISAINFDVISHWNWNFLVFIYFVYILGQILEL